MNKEEATELLENGVLNIMNSKNYLDWLNFNSKFKSYSFNNSMLIYLQKPNATRVTGLKSWNKMGRMVKAGEHGITIFYPRIKTVKNEETDEEETELRGFGVCSVFDISQTSGEDVPELNIHELDDHTSHEELKDKIIHTSSCPIMFKDITNGSKGYFSSSDNTITIKTGMSDLQTIKTMIHEIAHSIMDSKTSDVQTDKQTREMRAESVAYLVGNWLGLDTSDYSFSYIASWSNGKDLNSLKSNMNIIKKTAYSIYQKLK